MRKRYSEEQIIKILEEGRAGMKVEELCRKHGISQPTYYKLNKLIDKISDDDVMKATRK